MIMTKRSSDRSVGPMIVNFFVYFNLNSGIISFNLVTGFGQIHKGKYHCMTVKKLALAQFTTLLDLCNNAF